MITKLESIGDALAAYHDYHSPESDSYRRRNPGNLTGKASTDTPHAREKKFDADGFRVFDSHRAGYQSLINALEKRCQRSPEASLKSLLEAFGIKFSKPVAEALDFIARSLNVSSVSADTKLKFFLE
jgi:hypothetical protein